MKKWLSLILICLVCLGGGGAIAQTRVTPAQVITTDVIPKQLEQSLEIYLANCSSCHIALPAETLPTQTWQRLLENPDQHYGQALPLISGVEIALMWDYLQAFSRPLLVDERVPSRLREARVFRALHPQLQFPTPPTVNTCVSCHPSASQFNFRVNNQTAN